MSVVIRLSGLNKVNNIICNKQYVFYAPQSFFSETQPERNPIAEPISWGATVSEAID